MVDANDPFVRETRWLAHLEEEERVYDRTAKRWSGTEHGNAKFSEHAEQLRELRHQIEAKLPPQVQPIKHNPTVDQMFTALDAKDLYPLYIYLSQYVHGGHAATMLYRRGVGTLRQPGEYISAPDWYLPLRMCWLAVSEPGSLVLWRLGSQKRRYVTEGAARRVEARLRKVQSLSDASEERDASLKKLTDME